MDSRQDDVPPVGRHQGARIKETPTSNVRAHPPPIAPSGTPPRIFHQLLHAPGESRYQIRSAPRWQLDTIEPGYEEQARSFSFEAIVGGLPKGHRFAVFENPLTDDVVFDADAALTADWHAGHRFDRATIFDDAREAAAYAEERKKEFAREL